MDLQEKIETCAKWIAESERIVVFTGAGISTESGLPDFRGPNGLWTRRDKGLPPPKTTKPWHMVEPNPAHNALVELQDMNKLDFVISQNVDNLHYKSGIKLEKLTELHGNMTLMKCLQCNKKMTFEDAGWDQNKWGKGYRTSRIRKGQPVCPNCGGRLINSIVNFGDPLPQEDLRNSIIHTEKCDVFLVIGSSLVVYPAAEMPAIAYRAGAKLIIINKGDTPYDNTADIRISENVAEIVPAIVEKVKQIISKNS